MEPTAQLLTENDPSRYQDYVTDAPHLKLLKRYLNRSLSLYPCLCLLFASSIWLEVMER